MIASFLWLEKQLPHLTVGELRIHVGTPVLTYWWGCGTTHPCCGHRGPNPLLEQEIASYPPIYCVVLPQCVFVPLCFSINFDLKSCFVSIYLCICSVQSRNLCNLKIALRILRIQNPDTACQSRDCAIRLHNLKIVQAQFVDITD